MLGLAKTDASPTFDIPLIYEDLVKRVVRDWSRPAAWKGYGDQETAIDKCGD